MASRNWGDRRLVLPALLVDEAQVVVDVGRAALPARGRAGRPPPPRRASRPQRPYAFLEGRPQRLRQLLAGRRRCGGLGKGAAARPAVRGASMIPPREYRPLECDVGMLLSVLPLLLLLQGPPPPAERAPLADLLERTPTPASSPPTQRSATRADPLPNPCDQLSTLLAALTRRPDFFPKACAPFSPDVVE